MEREKKEIKKLMSDECLGESVLSSNKLEKVL